MFPSIITALARGRRPGIIKLSTGQIEDERKRYASLGIEAIVTAASPYSGDTRLSAVHKAARLLRDQKVDLE